MLSRNPAARMLTEVGMGAAQLGNLLRETTDEEASAAVDAVWWMPIPSYSISIDRGFKNAYVS